LARLASGALASLLLFLAFLRWRPSALVVSLLLMPMTLFQWAGAGIDALSIGAAALALTLWMEGMSGKDVPSIGRVSVVGLLVVVVVGSRIHLAPLLLLPLTMIRPFAFGRVLAGLLPAVVVVAWVLFSLASTEHPRTTEMSTGVKLLAYASEPSRLLEIAWTTANTPSIMEFYGRSFVGVLGWLDTYLPDAMYSAWGWLLASAMLWSIVVADWRGFRWMHGLIALMALGSAVLVPLLLLLMWTPFDSPVVEGVQGRYFLLPALLLAMAIPAGRSGARHRVDRPVETSFLVLVCLYSLVATLPVLVARYYG